MFEPVGGWHIVDQARNSVVTPTSSAPVAGRLRINHYLTKSVWELIERRTARSIDTGYTLKKPLLEWLLHEKDWNLVEDRSAEVFLARMERFASDFAL
jgi:hypothetical protein